MDSSDKDTNKDQGKQTQQNDVMAKGAAAREERAQALADPKGREKTKLATTSPEYHGKTGKLSGIYIVNLLLSIVTLGIYSFWGKTRIRRYMTSHVMLNKDRFEYTGTGMELFTGWLKALLIFLPLIVAIEIPFVNLIALPIFFAIISVAVFLALRYRLSRTHWRGIRFSLGGLVKEYMILAIKRTLINIFTLGFRIPKSDIMKWSYIANHMKYGELEFKYKGDHKRLFWTNVVTLVIPVMLLIIIPMIAGGVMKGQELIERAKARSQQIQQMQQQTYDDGQTQQYDAPGTTNAPSYARPAAGQYATEQYDVMKYDDEYDNEYEDYSRGYSAQDKEDFKKDIEEAKKVGVFVVLIYGGIGIVMAMRLWYKAALWREKFRTLELHGIRFKCTVTGGGLLWLYFSNIMIAIGLLLTVIGILFIKPITIQRSVKYYTSNLKIGGDLDKLEAEQNKNAKPTGMGDALAADVGFDLGL